MLKLTQRSVSQGCDCGLRAMRGQCRLFLPLLKKRVQHILLFRQITSGLEESQNMLTGLWISVRLHRVSGCLQFACRPAGRGGSISLRCKTSLVSAYLCPHLQLNFKYKYKLILNISKTKSIMFGSKYRLLDNPKINIQIDG